MNLEHATPELFAALSKMQGEVENATKGSTNPHFKSRYADLAEVLNTVRPVMSANGLSVIQSPALSVIQLPGVDDLLVSVTTIIGHSGGGYITGEMSCRPAKYDGQGIGAATTYLRRYALAAFTGIAQEDDDGQSAVVNVKVSYPPIPPAKASEIKDELNDLGIDEEAFLKYYGATKIESITTDKLPLIEKAFAAKRKPKTASKSIEKVFEEMAQRVQS
jgi:hypothetical protein